MMRDRTAVEVRRSELDDLLAGPGSTTRPAEVPREAPRISEIAPAMEKIGREFASAVDWLSGRCAYGDGILCLSITENEVALHAGGYIRMSAVPSENTLKVRGGCYDGYLQPVTVCEKSLPLGHVSEQRLGEVLMETYDKLTRYYRTHVS